MHLTLEKCFWDLTKQMISFRRPRTVFKFFWLQFFHNTSPGDVKFVQQAFGFTVSTPPDLKSRISGAILLPWPWLLSGAKKTAAAAALSIFCCGKFSANFRPHSHSANAAALPSPPRKRACEQLEPRLPALSAPPVLAAKPFVFSFSASRQRKQESWASPIGKVNSNFAPFYTEKKGVSIDVSCWVADDRTRASLIVSFVSKLESFLFRGWW